MNFTRWKRWGIKSEENVQNLKVNEKLYCNLQIRALNERRDTRMRHSGRGPLPFRQGAVSWSPSRSGFTAFRSHTVALTTSLSSRYFEAAQSASESECHPVNLPPNLEFQSIRGFVRFFHMPGCFRLRQSRSRREFAARKTIWSYLKVQISNNSGTELLLKPADRLEIAVSSTISHK